MSTVNKWLNFLLQTVRDSKLGPTYTTRFLYMGSTIIYYAIGSSTRNYKILINEPKLSNLRGRLNGLRVDRVIHQGMQYLFAKLGYAFSLPNVDIPRQYTTAIRAVNNIKAFIDSRDVDGWRQAYKVENEAHYYPNGDRTTVFIDVNDNVDQDLTTLLPYPDKWTPLKYGDNVQKYLTPEWGNVVPPVNIEEFINVYNNNFVVNRDQDIKEILEAYDNMTDRERVIAEYFQGGKVTPPGIWNVWAIYAAKANNISEVRFSEFLYLLNKALFTASIVAWNAKHNKVQARPVQIIRLLRPEREVTTWDGTRVSNKVWRPFQQSAGRTPPFPDFISGHSTFSGTAATIFNKYFGSVISNINFPPMSAEHADMISPLLRNELGSTVKKILCQFGSSEVYQGDAKSLFPACAVTLNFQTWDELAELSGISRIYGGIHGNSANGIGLIIGKLIAQKFI